MYRLLLFLILSTSVFATTSGPLSPSSSSINTSIGTINWNNPSNIYSSDNVKCLSDGMVDNDVTYYLESTNFGFNIPSTATIDGIVVEIERGDLAGIGGLKDNSVKIIKNGVITGTDKASGTAYPNGDTYKSYGNSTNLWGETWTYTDINSSNFGVAISSKRTSSGAANTVEIDHIRITIYYTDPLPIELLEFTTCKNTINWTTVSEINSNQLLLQSSTDCEIWTTVYTERTGSNSTVTKHYSHTDTLTYRSDFIYYRLKQIDNDGKITYFGPISTVNTIQDSEILRELPLTDFILIQYLKNGVIRKVIKT